MCNCPVEWTGPHCEFYKGKDASATPEIVATTTAAPKTGGKPQSAAGCARECSNGGVCQKGEAMFPDDLGTTAKGEPVPFLLQTSDSFGEYCWCPEGWTGFDCAHSYKFCKEPNGTGTEGFACFHGGKCESVSVDIVGQTNLDQTLCDCSAANWGGFEEGLFAGRHCEFKATGEYEPRTM